MQENTNKALVVNSLILYLRLFISSVCGLFATRYALEALGEADFGLFSIVGSIIIFMSIVNTVMLSASNRFLATAIGRGDHDEVNKVFNVNFVIHTAISIFTLVLGLTLGHYYIYHYLNYSGDIEIAVRVFDINLLGAVVSFIGVPFNGLILARERFFVFCFTDIVSSMAKVIVSYALIYYFVDKLSVYALVYSLSTAFSTFVFIFYCWLYFRDVIRFKWVVDTSYYKKVLSFSIWVGYGALAQVGKAQAAALLINAFFNTLMNTAYGIANYVLQMITLIAQNITKPISPQITKSYAAGDGERCITLMTLSAKVSFIMVFLISVPLFCNIDYVLFLWLGKVPEFASLFSQLIIINCLVDALSNGIAEYIFAGGKIRAYQFWVNTIYLISVPAAYFILLLGVPVWSVLVVYIAFSVIIFFVRQIILKKDYNFPVTILVRRVYMPSLAAILLTLPLVFGHIDVHPLFNIAICLAYALCIVVIVCLSRSERSYIIRAIRSRISR